MKRVLVVVVCVVALLGGLGWYFATGLQNTTRCSLYIEQADLPSATLEGEQLVWRAPLEVGALCGTEDSFSTDGMVELESEVSVSPSSEVAFERSRGSLTFSGGKLTLTEQVSHPIRSAYSDLVARVSGAEVTCGDTVSLNITFDWSSSVHGSRAPGRTGTESLTVETIVECAGD